MTELTVLRDRVATLEKQMRRSRSCSQKEAATYLGRSREYIRLLVKRGKLRKNGDNQYDYAALDALLDEQGR
jgi:hypothetical protein